MKKIFYFLILSTLTVNAQTATDIVNKLEAKYKNAQDISFELEGEIFFSESKEDMEIDVKILNQQKVVRLEFDEPSSLKGDIIVADAKEVRQFWSMANQITVNTTKSTGSNLGLDFGQLSNVNTLKNKYNVSLLGANKSSKNKIFQLKAVHKNSKQIINLWVSDEKWEPSRVQILDPNGKILADLEISNIKINSSLSENSVRQMPKNAKIIK